jgi:putative hydrolase
MISVDFHSHSLFSRCGLHTIVEMLVEAKRKGLKALAITDHGPALKSTIASTFWDRLFDPVEGIRLIKGMECNIISDEGDIDFPKNVIKFIDIVLLGIHLNMPSGRLEDINTEILIKACEKNPFVDIITHPEDIQYPIDFVKLAEFSKKKGIALECNNSKILNNRVPKERMLKYLSVCKEKECLLVVNSDAHALNEIGRDDCVRPLLDEIKFPQELIINQKPETAFAFIENRRKIKLDFYNKL